MDKLVKEKIYMIMIVQVCVFGVILGVASISSLFLVQDDEISEVSWTTLGYNIH